MPLKIMAPESLNLNVYTEKSDIWAFGILCWEMFNGGEEPFSVLDSVSLALAVRDYSLRVPVNKLKADEEIKALISKCQEDSPNQRPSFGQIMDILSDYCNRGNKPASIGGDMKEQIKKLQEQVSVLETEKDTLL